jgi:hypothetical protein
MAFRSPDGSIPESYRRTDRVIVRWTDAGAQAGASERRMAFSDAAGT